MTVDSTRALSSKPAHGHRPQRQFAGRDGRAFGEMRASSEPAAGWMSMHKLIPILTVAALAASAPVASAADDIATSAVDLDRIYRGADGSALYTSAVGDKVVGYGEHPGTKLGSTPATCRRSSPRTRPANAAQPSNAEMLHDAWEAALK